MEDQEAPISTFSREILPDTLCAVLRILRCFRGAMFPWCSSLCLCGLREGYGREARAADAGLVVILWRAGLRIQEAIDLTEADLDQRRGSLLVRRGKGGRRREFSPDGKRIVALAGTTARIQALPDLRTARIAPRVRGETPTRRSRDPLQSRVPMAGSQSSAQRSALTSKHPDGAWMLTGTPCAYRSGTLNLARWRLV